MASTDVEICNLSLQRVRSGPISLLTEDTTDAESCRAIYDLLLEEVLEDHNWRFARKYRALSLIEENPPEWRYSFDYPTECIKPRYIVFEGWTAEGNKPIPFEVSLDDNDKRRILCDIPEPILIFTAKITDVRQFSAGFVNVFAWRMAMDLAVPVGGESGAKYGENAESQFAKAWLKATGNDANMSQPRNTRLPKNIAVRNSARSRAYPDWRGE